jgi:hypothetical protein
MRSAFGRLVRGHSLFTLIPPFFLDCVIAIGLSVGGQNVPPQTSSMATGFLVGQSVPEHKGQYRVFLVTCNHVIEGLTQAMNDARTQAKGPITITPLIRFNRSQALVHESIRSHLRTLQRTARPMSQWLR